jgi:hypothetical protein
VGCQENSSGTSILDGGHNILKAGEVRASVDKNPQGRIHTREPMLVGNLAAEYVIQLLHHG